MTSKVLVVGSGVLGLRTALELLRKKIPVVLRSSHPPLHNSTCSMGAGGLWMPFKCDDPRVDKWSIDTLDELLNVSKNADSPVEIVPSLYLTSSHRGPNVDDFVKSDYTNKLQYEISSPIPKWTKDPRLSFQHLTIEMLLWQNSVLNLRIPSEEEMFNAGYTHAWLFNPPVVDTPRMLQIMLEEITSNSLIQNSSIDTNTTYNSLEEMVNDAKDLGCDAVVNCTGLGAAHLCDDSSLFGGKGVILNYDRSCSRREYDGQDLKHDTCILTEEGEWGSAEEPCYMIPRGDVLVVGGSYKVGDQETTLREEERKRLEKNAWIMGIDTKKSNPKSEWIGWRPCRPTVRVEIDNSVDSSIRVVHSYGVGGSGWTVFAGVAKEAVKLLFD